MVVFVFRFHALIAFLEYRPKFPIPVETPRALERDLEPRVKVPLLKPVLTKSIFCSVFLLQNGQNLFVVFGTFMFYET